MILRIEILNTICKYLCYKEKMIYEIELGRAKAPPKIWPASDGFWVARLNPGHIIEGP